MSKPDTEKSNTEFLKVNANRLEKLITEYSQSELSEQLGKERSWLTQKKGCFSMEKSVAVKLAAILGCNEDDFKMSRANTYMLKVDADRLKKLIKEKKCSQSEISVKLGRERSWIAQKKGCFNMEGNTAADLAAILGCGVEDFKAKGEPGVSPIYFKMEDSLAQKLSKIPTEYLPLVMLMLEKLPDASAQQLLNLREVLMNSPKPAKPQISSDKDHWLQEFVLAETHEVFYDSMKREMEKYPIIPDENDLYDMVRRYYETTNHNYGETLSLIESYLCKNMMNFEDIIAYTTNSVIKSCANLLLSYTLKNKEAALRIKALNERLATTDNVPRSNKT